MLVHVFESAKTEAEMRERADHVIEAIKSKELKISDISIRDVAEATLGVAGMRALAKAPTESGFSLDSMKEAVAPVQLSLFSNITGQMIFQGVYEAYTSPEYIGDKLVTAESSREDNTRVPGLAPIDDDAMVVEEGGEYPDVKFGEDYVDTPQSKKRGMKIGITREAVFFDRTGQILEMARTVGDRLALNKEKRILRTVMGLDASFRRKGVASATYTMAGSRINELVNVLADYTDLDNTMAAFGSMRDDRSVPEPIVVSPKLILINDALQFMARNIINATEIAVTPAVSNNASKMANPYAGTVSPVTSPWIRLLLTQAGVANPGSYWWMGDFKKAFRYRTLFPMQVIAAQHDKDSFERDVIAQFRADERGVAYVWAPWYVVENHQ